MGFYLTPIIRKTLSNFLKPNTWVRAVLGTGAMQIFFKIAPKLGLTKIDYLTENGTYIFPPGKKAKLTGALIYLSGSLGWVSLYKALKGRVRGSSTIKGLKFSTMMFLVASGLVAPMSGLTNPQMRRGRVKRPGVFNLNLEGWKGPLTALCGHLIFGLVISRDKGKNK